MKIYTDGSVKGNKGGAAAVSDEGHEWSRFVASHNSYFVELDAILLACQKTEGRHFSLFTDVRAIADELRRMKGFDDWQPPNKAKDVWLEISKYRDNIDGVEWLKRRSNNYMKQVDDLARDAASNGR